MAYLLDDDLAHDQRFRDLRRSADFTAAFSLYVLIGVYCAHDRTDGRIMRGMARGLLPSSVSSESALAALLEVGFLVEDEDADEYAIPDYLKRDGGWNESLEEMIERKSKTNQRQKRFQKRRKANGKPNGNHNALGDASDNSPPVPCSQSPVPSDLPSGDLPPTPREGGGADGELGLEAKQPKSKTKRARSSTPAVKQSPAALPPGLEPRAVIAAIAEGYREIAGCSLPTDGVDGAGALKLGREALEHNPSDPLGSLRTLGRELARKSLKQPMLYAKKHGFNALPVATSDTPSTTSEAQDPEYAALEAELLDVQRQLAREYQVSGSTKVDALEVRQTELTRQMFARRRARAAA